MLQLGVMDFTDSLGDVHARLLLKLGDTTEIVGPFECLGSKVLRSACAGHTPGRVEEFQLPGVQLVLADE